MSAVAEACHDLNLIQRSARLRASRRMAAGLMVRDTRLRGLLTKRVSLALRADLPPWQIKSGHRAAANQPDGQITSDFQKSCQAPFAKIFCFAPDPNQFTDSHRLVPTRGADRASSRNAGRDAVDAAASGEQQRAGRMTPKRTAKSCRSDAPMLASSLR